jgi:hypothetical protein
VYKGKWIRQTTEVHFTVSALTSYHTGLIVGLPVNTPLSSPLLPLPRILPPNGVLSPPEVCWIINCIEHLGALLFFLLPCYYYFYVYRHEHHMITKACFLLLIPDLMQIINFLPIHLLDLHNGYLDDDNYCKASAYLIVASIFASNGANITVAYVTKRMLDPKDQKVTVRLIATAGVVSWALGLLQRVAVRVGRRRRRRRRRSSVAAGHSQARRHR